MKHNLQKKTTPYMFITPFLILYMVFMLYPIIFSLLLCFSKYSGAKLSFVGLKNFKYILADKLFYKAIGNTFLMMIVQVPVQTFLALAIACLLNRRDIRGLGVFRMIIFMPILLDAVSYSIIFRMFFNFENGLINNVLEALGLLRLDWMNNPWLARTVLVLAITWRWTGYNTVIMLGGLQSIPYELYEAASINGANGWRKFWSITVPSMKPVIVFAVILSITGMLQLFTESYLLTGGGPVNATMTIVQYLYQMGFKSFNFGVASAGSLVLVLIIGVMTFLQLRITKED